MKKFLIIFLSFLLVSCNFTDKNNEKNKENSSNKASLTNNISSEEIIDNSILDKKKDIKYSYKLDKSDTFKRDSSLYVNRLLFTYPSEITAKEGDPYNIDDLRNLDYSKDISFSLQNFRIPQRAEIFSNDNKLYSIALPKNEKYDIDIYFKKIFDDYKYKGNKLKDMTYDKAKTFMEELEKKDGVDIIHQPISISDKEKQAYYFMAEDKENTHTYLFVSSPNNIIFFDFVEKKNGHEYSKYIMADLLSTMYIDSEDPLNVGKDFKNYTKNINLFATKDLQINDISLKLPENMKIKQNDENFKVFANESKDKTISQIMIISQLKKIEDEDNGLDYDFDMENPLSLVDVFDESSGTSIPPIYLVNMGRVYSKKIKSFDSLSSDVRIYMENYTSEGVKTSIETDKLFVTIIVTGPLSNSNEIKLLNKNIVNSIKPME